MKRFARAIWISGLVLAVALLGGCDYARMRNQEAVKTYEKKMPEMDSRAIPDSGGYNVLRTADPAALKNPWPVNADTVRRGREAYGYFCIHCHGPRADGQGTVGQSFAPLPTDLSSQRVQMQSDGQLMKKILLGSGRHPRLYSTVSEEETWAIVRYVRSLKKVNKG